MRFNFRGTQEFARLSRLAHELWGADIHELCYTKNLDFERKTLKYILAAAMRIEMGVSLAQIAKHFGWKRPQDVFYHIKKHDERMEFHEKDGKKFAFVNELYYINYMLLKQRLGKLNEQN